MAPPLGVEIFSRGFRFLPTPEEAVTYYLPRLISGNPLHDAVRPVIHHADVYTCAPADLARHFRPLPRTGDRFFFTSGSAKRARGAANRDGSWHAQNTTDIKGRGGDNDDAKVGELRKLRYKKSGGAYTDWLMDEYSCSVAAGESSQFVLCKMYVSPRAALTSAAHKESAAYFSFTLQPPPPPSVAVVMQKKVQPPSAAAVTQMQMRPAPTVAPKRQATPPMSPPCAKRMRRDPIVQPAGGNVSFSMPPPPSQPSCAPPPVVPTRPPLAVVDKMPLAPPRQPPLAPPAPTTLSSFTAVRNIPLAPPHPSAPRRGSAASAPHPAPPVPMPGLPTPPVARACHVPLQVSFSMPPPQRSCAPPTVVPTRSPLAGVGKIPLAPPQPHPFRPAMRPQCSPMPLPAPQQQPRPQQVQVPTPPVVHVPVQSKQRRILDPFEAADMLSDEDEEQTVAATTPALQDQDQDEEDDWDDLAKALEFDD